MNRRLILKGLPILAVLVLALASLVGGCQNREAAPLSPSQPALSPAVKAWQREHTDKSVVIWAEGDLNADGRADTVIIYRAADGRKCFTQILLSEKGEYKALEPVPAPVENQTIQFRDIDKKPPTELVISGMKAGDVGYAIYRIENGKLLDLFAQDMEKCC